MEFSERLNRTNGRLKAAKLPCRIDQVKQNLYVRGTFPPPPGSTKDRPFQQRIALGLPANGRGLELAEAKAREIGIALDADRFSWEEWRGKPAQSVGEWVERFEQKFFREGGHQTTWKTDYRQPFDKLPSEAELTLVLLVKVAETTSANTRSRLRACNAFRQLAEFAGLSGEELAAIKGNYSSKEVDPRSLPNDEQIATWRELVKDPGWRWLYGMIAAYGLRPHEVFRCELHDFPTVRVLEETKTGARFVWPLYPEWAEAWALHEQVMPPLELERGYDNAQLGTKVTKFFNRLGKCEAYDLRHSFARRLFEFGYAPEFGAKLMGHSPETHGKVYRRWIDEAVYRRVYEAALKRDDRPLAPTVTQRS